MQIGFPDINTIEPLAFALLCILILIFGLFFLIGAFGIGPDAELSM